MVLQGRSYHRIHRHGHTQGSSHQRRPHPRYVEVPGGTNDYNYANVDFLVNVAGRAGVLHKIHASVLLPASKRLSTRMNPPSMSHSVDLMIVSPTFVSCPEFDNVPISFSGLRGRV
jgi:hypothetical protein